jgi:branched-chain amino acid transport system ATP-binding protein
MRSCLLECKGLTKYFGGLKAVEELDFTVEKGQIVGLIGPNGAGKTTVFNTITGKFRPTRGKVIFNGKDITGLKPHTIVGLGLARAFQKTLLFEEMTVLENILVGFHLKSEINFRNSLLNTVSVRQQRKRLLEKAAEVASFLEINNFRHRLAKNLPHGYQRLLGLGIALATDPQLLLLDEPATGMNTEETDQMLVKIKELNDRGITILLVEHDMRLVMNVCEHIVVLNFGSKIAEGTPAEICEDKEVIAAYLGSEHAIRC